jgi:ubiquinone/menaquinone biosynthesis C-methylase UbiE
VHGIAERLPLDDQSVDASMALVTVHQWQNLDELRELTRVTRARTSCSRSMATRSISGGLPTTPELIAVERRRYPAIATIVADSVARRTSE